MLVISQAAAAQSYTSLSQWVQRQAGPELVQQLAHHPKFKGESLRFGAVEGQQPFATPNQLIDDLNKELIHQVLAEGSNDVIAPNHMACRAGQGADYFIGLEISGVSRYKHRAQIQAYDVSAQRWVSGVSIAWQGRLSRQEAAALGRSLYTPVPGTSARPLSGTKDPRLAGALSHLMDCAQLERVAGTIATPEASELADKHISDLVVAVSNYLQTDAPALIADSDIADWRLMVSRVAENKVDRYKVNLRQNHGTRTIPLGALYVARSNVSVDAKTQSTDLKPTHYSNPRVSHIDPNAPVFGYLLGRVRPTRATECRKCVSFELKQPAYTLVFSTVGNRVMVQRCEQPVRWREAGPLQFRVHERYQSSFVNRPRYGFYALASHREDLLLEIAEILVQHTGQCGDQATSDVSRLINAIEHAGDQIDWRAYHARQTSPLFQGG